MFLFDWFYGILAPLDLWQKEAKILFLGLDNAGKTTLLHMLKDERPVQDQPAQYPTSEEFSIGKIKFKAFDLGGHQIARRVLRDYCGQVDAVVYLFDVGRFEESREELDALRADESLARVPFLILGNMIESEVDLFAETFPFIVLRDRIDIDSLAFRFLLDYMGLTNFTTGQGRVNLPDNVRPLEVFICSIDRKMEYVDAFKWLSQYIIREI